MGIAEFFTRPKSPPLASVSANDVPCQDRIDAALTLGASIIKSVEIRASLIRELEIDPKFCDAGRRLGFANQRLRARVPACSLL